MNILEVNDLFAYYGNIPALRGVSFTVPEGSIITLLGANGAGKTTTLRALTGLVRTSGRIVYRGTSLHGKPTQTIVRMGIAHIPEGRGTFSGFTVEENLRLGAYARKDKKTFRAGLEKVYEYFPPLFARRNQQAGTLSGGEQQMLAIGRGLIAEPDLLLVDELSLGLAPKLTRAIMETIKRLNEETGLSILLVEQNAALALETAAYAYVLEVGRIVIHGDGQTLLDNDSVRRAYLGY